MRLLLNNSTLKTKKFLQNNKIMTMPETSIQTLLMALNPLNKTKKNKSLRRLIMKDKMWRHRMKVKIRLPQPRLIKKFINKNRLILNKSKFIRLQSNKFKKIRRFQLQQPKKMYQLPPHMIMLMKNTTMNKLKDMSILMNIQLLKVPRLTLTNFKVNQQSKQVLI